MVVGILEDFTNDVQLDSELLATPTSGIYVNSGGHPSVNVNNLLEFLPNTFNGIQAWSASTTYGKYEDTRKRSDLVTLDGTIYQSIKVGNLNNSPDAPGTTHWIETNLESLVLKNHIYSTMDRVKSELNLVNRLVNSQMLYEVGRHEITLPNDYAAWVFEPKGSDYISFRINRISLQKKSLTPVNVYVVNQGVLVDTLSVTPDNGRLQFQELGYNFSGKGKWYFIIDSTDVLVDGGAIDNLAYDGFVAYTASGTGASPETATFNDGVSGNGLGFDISVYLDPSEYLKSNLQGMGSFIRATFDYLTLQMFLHNPNNVSNRSQRIQMQDDILIAEAKSMEGDTVAKRFASERKKAVSRIEKTFDTQLNDNGGFEIEFATV